MNSYKIGEARKECCTTGAFKDRVVVEKLVCQAIVGVKEPERMQRQKVVIDVTMYLDTSCCSLMDNLEKTISYATVAREVLKYTEESKHYLLETLCHGIARMVCLKYGAPECTVRVEKPRAIPLADQAVVEITRTREFFTEEQARESLKAEGGAMKMVVGEGESLVFLALGSNLGDTVSNLSTAVDRIVEATKATSVSTSGLYSTPPTYVTDQPSFVNACIAISTAVDPFSLLRIVKEIEAQMGRDFTTQRNGPRVIDIDILMHGDVKLEAPTLIIPHQEMHKRLFVMLPLCDVAHAGTTHPVVGKTFESIRDTLLINSAKRVVGEENPLDLVRILPLAKNATWELGRKTVVLGIANTAQQAAMTEGVAGVLVGDLNVFKEVRKNVENQKVVFAPKTKEDLVGGLALEPEMLKLPQEVLNDLGKLKETAELLKGSQCGLILEAPSVPTPVDYMENVVAALQVHGIHRWRVVIDPCLEKNAVQLLKGDITYSTLWHPQAWSLQAVSIPSNSSPSLSVLTQTAVQKNAAFIITPNPSVTTDVCSTADALFRSGWN
eukprot:TRINITY_DN24122_c0_g1_i1.p1 TRINITY_DN24122_c0_g1~~TRINITY_DN24122_c0_g1_i1.p1  ORF type:complete len:553 (+),score=157.66 TRINITY_DN24122_c0_g1_i1:45-1703(+)